MGYFDKFNREGIPFMEGREKGDKKEIIGRMLHFQAFGFIEGKNGPFAVMVFQEIPNKFFFGNSIVSEMLREVQKDGMENELYKQVILFEERTSKEGNAYTAFRFIS